MRSCVMWSRHQEGWQPLLSITVSFSKNQVHPTVRCLWYFILMVGLTGSATGHRRIRSLRRSMREFLDWVYGGEKTHPKGGSTIHGLRSRVEKKGKSSLVPAFSSPCFLTTDAVWPVTFCSSDHGFSQEPKETPVPVAASWRSTKMLSRSLAWMARRTHPLYHLSPITSLTESAALPNSARKAPTAGPSLQIQPREQNSSHVTSIARSWRVWHPSPSRA